MTHNDHGHWQMVCTQVGKKSWLWEVLQIFRCLKRWLIWNCYSKAYKNCISQISFIKVWWTHFFLVIFGFLRFLGPLSTSMLLRRMRCFFFFKTPNTGIEVSQIHMPPGAFMENSGGIIRLARRRGVRTLQWLSSIVNTEIMRVEPQNLNISIYFLLRNKSPSSNWLLSTITYCTRSPVMITDCSKILAVKLKWIILYVLKMTNPISFSFQIILLRLHFKEGLGFFCYSKSSS